MSGDYTNSMDKEFAANVQQIGSSANPMQHQTEALKARIFHGASVVEFGFMGGGKTNSQNPGPEAFGRDERRDMRELAMINNIKTSTHATTAIHGLSGLQQGGYSSEAQEATMYELKKAIDFASDASSGGAVVFHTGEGPRSMYSNLKNKDGSPMFELHGKEKQEEIHYLVDPIDKKIIGGVKEDAYMFLPEQEKKYNEKTGKMERVWLTDEHGKVIEDSVLKSKIPVYKVNSKGEVETKKMTFSEWKGSEESQIYLEQQKEQHLKKEGDLKNFNPEVAEQKGFFWKQQEGQILYQLGHARHGLGSLQQGMEERDKLIKSLKYYRDLKEKIPEKEWKDNFENITKGHSYAQQAGLVIPEKVDPVEFLKQQLIDNERSIAYGRDLAVSGLAQARDVHEKFERAQSLQEFSKNEVTDRMAEAALYAHEKTKQRIAEDKKVYGAGDPSYHSPLEKNPLYISPEAWQPQDYGSHPDEIREFIKTARDKTYENLKNNMHYTESEARKIADQSIKATVDIGHMNNWRKHFVREKGETLEKYHNRFDKWLLTETEKLAKEGLIGHVHLSDNFGYHDEHLAVGQGNAPIKEFVANMRKHGVEEFISESGSFNINSALTDAWSHLGSPIYRVGAPGAGSELDAWGNVHQGYFGQTEPPRYIVGEYAPSEDFRGSPFYSGTPLE